MRVAYYLQGSSQAEGVVDHFVHRTEGSFAYFTLNGVVLFEAVQLALDQSLVKGGWFTQLRRWGLSDGAFPFHLSP